MQVGIPRLWHNAVGECACRILPIRHQDGVEAVVCAVVLSAGRDERRVCLRVGVDQQHAAVGCSCLPQHPDHAEGDIGGGRRSSPTPPL